MILYILIYILFLQLFISSLINNKMKIMPRRPYKLPPPRRPYGNPFYGVPPGSSVHPSGSSVRPSGSSVRPSVLGGYTSAAAAVTSVRSHGLCPGGYPPTAMVSTSTSTSTSSNNQPDVSGLLMLADAALHPMNAMMRRTDPVLSSVAAPEKGDMFDSPPTPPAPPPTPVRSESESDEEYDPWKTLPQDDQGYYLPC